jgi:hypothetical protein
MKHTGQRDCKPGTLCRLLLPLLAAALNAHCATIVLEAENGTLTGTSVSTTAAGYSDSGYVTGFDNPGDSVRWTFGASNGFYNLRIRFRSEFGQKGFDATLNGSTTSGMFPQSTSFATFDVGLVELTNGNNTLEIGGAGCFHGAQCYQPKTGS